MADLLSLEMYNPLEHGRDHCFRGEWNCKHGVPLSSPWARYYSVIPGRLWFILTLGLAVEQAEKSRCTNNHLQRKRRNTDDHPRVIFTVKELEWFSRTTYNIGLTSIEKWHPSISLRILNTCIKVFTVSNFVFRHYRTYLEMNIVSSDISWRYRWPYENKHSTEICLLSLSLCKFVHRASTGRGPRRNAG